MPSEALNGDVHVWFAQPERLQDRARIAHYLELLDAGEQARYRRLLDPADRHRYLAAHALLRITLSRYAAPGPAAWRFSPGTHGRPEIVNPGLASLRFNLTHTEGLVGCVLCGESACGIDAEARSPRHKLPGIARRMFSVREYRELQALDGALAIDYFYTHWTLREAYVKALGIGIAYPTARLDFRVDKRLDIVFDDASDGADRPERWQFDLLQPTEKHIAAVAVETRGGSRRALVTRMATL